MYLIPKMFDIQRVSDVWQNICMDHLEMYTQLHTWWGSGIKLKLLIPRPKYASISALMLIDS